MRNVGIIARRELAGYLRTPSGYMIAAATLLVQGLLFNTRALGGGAKLSSQVLMDFLRDSSGTTTVCAVLLAMRLFAEERQSGTVVLLQTSPVREAEIVVGKFAAAFTVLAAITLLSLYLPALIFVNGKVSLGHIAGGYAGLLCVGAATLSLSLLGSAMARNQLVAGVLAAVFIFVLFLTWQLSRVVDPPLGTIISYFSLYERHFFPFMRGLVQRSDIVYYASIVYLARFASTRVVQSQGGQCATHPQHSSHPCTSPRLPRVAPPRFWARRCSGPGCACCWPGNASWATRASAPRRATRAFCCCWPRSACARPRSSAPAATCARWRPGCCRRTWVWWPPWGCTS
jgi:ABC-2 type transport system permease protein